MAVVNVLESSRVSHILVSVECFHNLCATLPELRARCLAHHSSPPALVGCGIRHFIPPASGISYPRHPAFHMDSTCMFASFNPRIPHACSLHSIPCHYPNRVKWEKQQHTYGFHNMHVRFIQSHVNTCGFHMLVRLPPPIPASLAHLSWSLKIVS